mmetsp:Transcript_10117/g.23066  ORF Transcript_10117/g.23066 Transcript_10117/m.23066 type:complete len:283 (-) Transcript_10117:79-927(-)
MPVPHTSTATCVILVPSFSCPSRSTFRASAVCANRHAHHSSIPPRIRRKPRESEIRIQCAPGEPSFLASVEEVSTCRYLVQFSSNLLCKHPAFAADKKKSNVEAIQCEPLDEHGQPMPAPKKAPSSPAKSTPPARASPNALSDDVTTQAGGNEEAVHVSSHAVNFDLGQCFLHHKYNYRGVIIGYDTTCQQSESWIRSMSVDSLKYGRDQPFYHVLPDIRDRPGAQITYVAQENIVIDTPSEALQHPIIDDMFSHFDADVGRFQPADDLRAKYPSQASTNLG